LRNTSKLDLASLYKCFDSHGADRFSKSSYKQKEHANSIF